MAGIEKRQRGRPPTVAKEGVKTTLSLRVTPEMKTRLEAAGTSSGRNLSQEAEIRLEHSFRAEQVLDQALDFALGPQGSGFVMLVARVIRYTGSQAGFAKNPTLEGATNWLADPYAVDQVRRAINALLDAMQPPGEIKPPQFGAIPGTDIDLDAIYREHLGRGFARALLSAVAGHAPTAELERVGKQIGDRLGPDVVDRVRTKLGQLPNG